MHPGPRILSPQGCDDLLWSHEACLFRCEAVIGGSHLLSQLPTVECRCSDTVICSSSDTDKADITACMGSFYQAQP
jgi:hypothetical protein